MELFSASLSALSISQIIQKKMVKLKLGRKKETKGERKRLYLIRAEGRETMEMEVEEHVLCEE